MCCCGCGGSPVNCNRLNSVVTVGDIEGKYNFVLQDATPEQPLCFPDQRQYRWQFILNTAVVGDSGWLLPGMTSSYTVLVNNSIIFIRDRVLSTTQADLIAYVVDKVGRTLTTEDRLYVRLTVMDCCGGESVPYNWLIGTDAGCPQPVAAIAVGAAVGTNTLVRQDATMWMSTCNPNTRQYKWQFLRNASVVEDSGWLFDPSNTATNTKVMVVSDLTWAYDRLLAKNSRAIFDYITAQTGTQVVTTDTVKVRLMVKDCCGIDSAWVELPIPPTIIFSNADMNQPITDPFDPPTSLRPSFSINISNVTQLSEIVSFTINGVAKTGYTWNTATNAFFWQFPTHTPTTLPPTAYVCVWNVVTPMGSASYTATFYY